MEMLLLLLAAVTVRGAAVEDWIERSPSGAYQFGYATGDDGGHYRKESASADNTIAGKYGFRDPASGAVLETTYTAGRKGFRAQGPHIARRMGLSQSGPSRPGDDGQYHPELDLSDPSESKAYDFSFRTRDVVKEEHADSRGDVRGRYTYIDDIGARRTVDYTAGANKGFIVNNAVPDTFAQVQSSPLYLQGKGPGPKPRGYTAIQKAQDGSYRFAASGPEHKQSEVSDAVNNRCGSYTYLDDKGVQRTVHYIAGPNIGFQIISGRRPSPYAASCSPISGAHGLGPFFPSSPTSIPSLNPFFPDALDFSPVGSTPSSPLSPGSSSLFPGSTTKPGSHGSTGSSSSSGTVVSSDASGSSDGSRPSGSSSGGASDTSSTIDSSKPTTSSWWSPSTSTSSGSSNSDSWPSSTPSYPTTSGLWSQSTPSWSTTLGPSWLDIADPGYGDFNNLHHQLFPETLNTAQSEGIVPRPNRPGSRPPSSSSNIGISSNELFGTLHSGEESHPSKRPGNEENNENHPHTGQQGSHHQSSESCCNRPWRLGPRPGSASRGNVKFQSSADDLSLRKLALRAHVQSIDMLEGKRFMSPSEALNLYSRKHPEHR